MADSGVRRRSEKEASVSGSSGAAPWVRAWRSEHLVVAHETNKRTQHAAECPGPNRCPRFQNLFNLHDTRHVNEAWICHLELPWTFAQVSISTTSPTERKGVNDSEPSDLSCSSVHPVQLQTLASDSNRWRALAPKGIPYLAFLLV